MKWPEDFIDHEPTIWVEADPFDWDEAMEFHEELRAARRQRELFENNERMKDD